MGATESERLVSRAQTAETCGDNLEYDPEFLALERAARPRADQFGSVVIPPPASDWNDVHRRALDLFAHTLDLRIAILFVRATLRIHGWVELAPALKVVRALI